jgi:hypothetical protein
MDTVSLILLGFVAQFILLALWRPDNRPAATLPYSRRHFLLAQAELRFYRVLPPVVPAGMVVFVKVRLMDVVAVSDDRWQQFGAPGSGRHLDFVLADGSTLAPLLYRNSANLLRSHRPKHARAVAVPPCLRLLPEHDPHLANRLASPAIASTVDVRPGSSIDCALLMSTSARERFPGALPRRAHGVGWN